jgi:hypothetical protein
LNVAYSGETRYDVAGIVNSNGAVL